MPVSEPEATIRSPTRATAATRESLGGGNLDEHIHRLVTTWISPFKFRLDSADMKSTVFHSANQVKISTTRNTRGMGA